MRTFTFACVALCVFSSLASAVVIDFEAIGTANGEGFKLGTVAGPVNVTFSLIGSANKAIVTKYGDTGPGTNNRMLGFNNLVEGRDTPAATDPDGALDPKTVVGPAGQYFLTNSNRRPENGMDYAISFDRPVTALSLLVYDFRADGNNADGNPGVDRLELQGFLGAAAAGVDTWTVPNPRPVDGVAVRLGLNTIVDRVIVHMVGSDFGTGIDNLEFTVVPEPSTASLLGMLVLSFLGVRRRMTA